jgi:hypothetical protein
MIKSDGATDGGNYLRDLPQSLQARSNYYLCHGTTSHLQVYHHTPINIPNHQTPIILPATSHSLAVVSRLPERLNYFVNKVRTVAVLSGRN